MNEGAGDRGAQDAADVRAPGGTDRRSRRSARRAGRTPRRSRLSTELAILAVVGVLLIAALGAGWATLYQQFWGPSAFVERYVGLIAAGRAADALEVPGVAVDATHLANAGLPETASDALLRRAALSALSDIHPVAEHVGDGGVEVTIGFRAGGNAGTSTFTVEQDGWTGILPSWRFTESPLAVIDVTVRGSMAFEVNGFTIDKRQVSPLGLDAPPLDPVALLVFSPGLYRVSVDTAIAETTGTDVLADAPLARVPLELQAEPTAEFVGVVQERVDSFLDDCATQQVLQPTACPFGFVVQNRIANLPTWSIVTYPTVTLVPDDAGWAMPPVEAVAHISVDIRSLFDGSVRTVEEDVTFGLDAEITVLPDGSASILVGSPEAE
ncbi:hypothetical protein [Microbacterium sp.]|uniref:hypothetical protein n=1 Tax=Microbacterium sp. TaxID=51671 RepID=UPI0037C9530D